MEEGPLWFRSLYEVFVTLGVPDELRMPLCAGTSLELIIPTSIASFTGHRKTNSVNLDLLRLWSVPRRCWL